MNNFSEGNVKQNRPNANGVAMTYEPPFTITTEIIDLISAVSEQVCFV